MNARREASIESPVSRLRRTSPDSFSRMRLYASLLLLLFFTTPSILPFSAPPCKYPIKLIRTARFFGGLYLNTTSTACGPTVTNGESSLAGSP